MSKKNNWKTVFDPEDRIAIVSLTLRQLSAQNAIKMYDKMQRDKLMKSCDDVNTKLITMKNMIKELGKERVHVNSKLFNISIKR